MDILFKNGIPGLDDYKEYTLQTDEELLPFNLLQSKDKKELGLVLISPFQVMAEYEVKLSEKVIKNLQITSPEDVVLYTTVTLNSNVEEITTNLRAPIVVNVKSGLGEQIIVDNDKYKIKHPISEER